MVNLLTIAFLFVLASSTSGIAETLRLRTGLDETSKSFHVIQSLANEIMRRTDITIKFIHLPAKRTINYLEAGLIDGDFSRVSNFGSEVPGLIRIPEPIATHPYVAYTINEDIVVNSWNSLKPYSVIYIGGWTVVEEKLTPIHDNLITVNSVEAGLNVIAAGRADIFISIPFLVNEFLKQKEWKGKPIRELQPPFDLLNSYVFLLSKHAVAGRKMNKALKEMKADNSYYEIVEERRE